MESKEMENQVAENETKTEVAKPKKVKRHVSLRTKIVGGVVAAVTLLVGGTLVLVSKATGKKTETEEEAVDAEGSVE